MCGGRPRQSRGSYGESSTALSAKKKTRTKIRTSSAAKGNEASVVPTREAAGMSSLFAERELDLFRRDRPEAATD